MDTPAQPPSPSTDRLTVVLRVVLGLVLVGILAVAIWYGWAYFVTPAAVRHPTSGHVHARVQIIVNGRPVNFADAAYQTAYNKDFCSATLTKEPFHFHDTEDQFLHMHWQYLTGGLLLKDYGWNLIGGPSSVLGYRFDQLPKLAAVPIHGHALPAVGKDTHFYIYTGVAGHYTQRSWVDFLQQDLDSFLKDTPVTATSWLDRLIPVASAHADDAQLVQLNHVQGNIVIFAQKDQPSNSQINDRFNHLLPLPETSCSG